MNYWRIVAGHPEPGQPDDVKSVQLGDWFRKNYVAIGHKRSHPLHQTFKYEVMNGDQIVVTTDRHVWAIGTIVSDEVRKRVPNGSYLYPYRREVAWSRLMKVPHSRFPGPLRRKLGIQQAISPLSAEDWTTLLSFI